MTDTPWQPPNDDVGQDDPRLAPESCRSTLSCPEIPEAAQPGALLTLPITIRNDGDRPLVGTAPHPVVLTYRWLLLDQTWVVGATRLPLAAPVLPGATATMDLPVEVPVGRRGPAYLRIALAQELVCYFDDVDPNNGLQATMYLTG